MPSENATKDSIRKAAILVSALDRDSADALLDKMGPEQAARVRNAVFELESISDDEQDAIVREFVLAGGGQVGPLSSDGREERQGREHEARPSFPSEDGQAAGHAAGLPLGGRTPKAPSAAPSDQADQPHHSEPTAEVGPFPILREASIETLASHLVHENPQVIAVVVAHLPPRRAAELIAHLVPRLQAEVLRRVAGLDAAAPAAIEILQQQLEAKLTEEIRSQRNRDVGLAAVNSILNAAGLKRDELLSNLSENDESLRQLVASAPAAPPPGTTERIEPRVAEIQTKPMANVVPDAPRTTRPSPSRELSTESQAITPDAAATLDDQKINDQTFDDQPLDDRAINDRTIQFKSEAVTGTQSIVFEQLAGLDDDSLAFLFGELDPEITLVALAGASPEFVQRVMQPLPPREARTLRRKMERLGPLRLSDIAAAQREVARTAEQMVNDGQLPGLVTPRFAVAA